MIDIVLDRIFAGLLTGVTIGTLFYLFPVFRHIFSHNYRNNIRDKYKIYSYKKSNSKQQY